MTDDDYKTLTLPNPETTEQLSLTKYSLWSIYWHLEDNGYFIRDEDTDHRFNCFCRGMLPSQKLSYQAVRLNPAAVEYFLNDA